MPHLTIEYTANLDAAADMPGLCRTLAATIVALRNDEGAPLFPVAGTRVLAYPAHSFAVADGEPDRGFIYMNMRIMAGRSEAMKQRAGDAVLAAASAHIETVFATRAVGLTLQLDEGAPVYEGKRNNLAGHLGKTIRPPA